MSTHLVRGINQAYSEQNDPLVFALTGRTGSGCSTAAATLTKSFAEIALSEEDFQQPERRKMSIALEFARLNWSSFTTLTVSSAIFSFLMDEAWKEIDAFLLVQGVPTVGREELSEHLRVLRANPSSYAFKKAMNGESSVEEKAAAWHFFESSLCPLAAQVRKVLGPAYPPLFQAFGDNVRFSGAPLDKAIKPNKLFSLMGRVRQLIECARAYRSGKMGMPSRIVIDAIRNPLELVYLRKHVPGILVVAITTDDEKRRARLLDSGLSKRDVDKIDEKEYSPKKHLEDYASFVSQNLRDCIQKSDVFVANPGSPGEIASSVRFMNAQLVRYVALALRPGIITPTRDERCMQIAFVAKLNSGCISRQVGAVVAGPDHSIHALGWNDTPKGQTSCLLRDVGSLLTGADAESFSEYEKTDGKLRSHLEKKFKNREQIRQKQGLRCPFCFKDAFNSITGVKNQVHTRSLHAEENAFLQITKRGGVGIAGGVLYTTASPCELCSKKAYQLGIREVVYVDPYPGISASHVLGSGPIESRPKLRLFSGSVGTAYHRLYEALLSIKDEYGARMSDEELATASVDVDENDSQTRDLWSQPNG